jgi:hypothetical protein
LIRSFIISATISVNVLRIWNSRICQTSWDIVRIFMSDVTFERIESFSIKSQKNAISRLNNISRRSSFSRFSNSFFIYILWIRSNFRRVSFVNSENLEMRNSANWFVKSLKYFFFLMMFSFHVTSSSNLKSSETQISLSFIFWSLRLYAMNIFVEFVERKNWTKVIKSFFLESLCMFKRFYQPEITWPNRDDVSHVTHAFYI